MNQILAIKDVMSIRDFIHLVEEVLDSNEDLTRQIITQYSRVEDPEEENIEPRPQITRVTISEALAALDSLKRY
jgi:hypothetical protein